MSNVEGIGESVTHGLPVDASKSPQLQLTAFNVDGCGLPNRVPSKIKSVGW